MAIDPEKNQRFRLTSTYDFERLLRDLIDQAREISNRLDNIETRLDDLES